MSLCCETRLIITEFLLKVPGVAMYHDGDSDSRIIKPQEKEN